MNAKAQREYDRLEAQDARDRRRTEPLRKLCEERGYEISILEGEVLRLRQLLIANGINPDSTGPEV